MASTGVARITGIDPYVAIKAPCKVATTGNITLSGAQTIDGVAVSETTPKTRVLVRAQTDSTENGIWDVYDTAWRRSDDFNGVRDVVDNTLVSVDGGSTYGDSTWRVEVTNPVVFGSSAISFVITNNLGTGRAEEYDSVAAMISDTPETSSVYISSYYGGWAGTVAGPKGGFFAHKTGATNTSPTSGSATTVSTIGHASQAGYFWDASGAEWKLSDQTLYHLEQFGAVADGDGIGGGTDNAVALQDAATFCEGKSLSGSGIYLTGTQIDFGTVYLYGDITIDGADIVDSGDSGDATVVNFEGGGLTQISDIDTNLNAGDQTLSFSSAHNLSEGDYLIIYNPTDSSFNASSTQYRAGEFCQVGKVSDSTTVIVSWPLYASYTAANVDIYSLSVASPHIHGKFKALAPDNSLLMTAIRFRYVADCNVSNVHGLCDAGEAALEFYQCINVQGISLIGNHYTNSTSGNDYGLLISNCQNLDLDGQFTGYRHGATVGGNNATGAVPNRNVVIRGTVATHGALSTVMAADWHGNAEYCGYDAQILGGITFGGDHNWIRGQIHANADGLVAYAGDLLGFDFDFQGCTFIARQDVVPSGRGSFDVGGNSAAPSSTTARGGTLDLSNTRWIMPATTVYPIFINNNGATGTELNVNLNNAKFIETVSSLTALFRIRAVSGDNFNRVSYEGITSDKDQVITIGDTDTIVRPKKSGSVAVSVTTSVAEASQAVTFDRRYDDAPAVVAGFREQDVGSGDYITYEVVSVTATGFTLVAHNNDGTNFSANTDLDFYWIAG